MNDKQLSRRWWANARRLRRTVPRQVNAKLTREDMRLYAKWYAQARGWKDVTL